VGAKIKLECFNILAFDLPDFAFPEPRQNMLLNLVQLRGRVSLVQLDVGEIKGLIDLFEALVLA
jgi:hypothetical protein